MKDSYIYKSPIGLLKICEKEGRITNLHLQQGDSSMAARPDTVWHSDLLYEAYKQLNEYFRGNRRQFDLPLQYEGTAFQRQIWSELQNIPYGETSCYEDIAVRIGNEKAVRAVGQANSRNPIMIIIPCHRVIRKDGEIGGFSCGIEAKKYLLKLERDNRRN